MKEYLYVTWSFDGRGGARAAIEMLRRCDLRHVAKQDADVEMTDSYAEPGEASWTTGASGSVRLPVNDPRIPLLLAELKRAGIEPGVIHYRKWTPSELGTSAWLLCNGWTSMVQAGLFEGQQWDFSAACSACGVGAVPIPPLILKSDRMPKSGFAISCPCGLVIVSKLIAEAMLKAKLTGFVIEPVRGLSRPRHDDRYRWVRITSAWPAPHASDTCRLRAGCTHCGRPTLDTSLDTPTNFVFDRVPQPACDLNSWQASGDPDERGSSTLNRPVGDPLLLILSQRAHALLKAAGVRTLKCEPIVINSRPA